MMRTNMISRWSMVSIKRWGAVAAFVLLPLPALAADIQISGVLEPEIQGFLENPGNREQRRGNFSVSGEITAEFFWDQSNQWIVFQPFARWDMQDGNRTHGDIREAKYARALDNWEFRIGIDKVFWGVTESIHLVDIINQDDAIESIDGEEKLGQPMLFVSSVWNIGTFEAWFLPYFRPRIFASLSGRPAPDLPVDENQARYESKRKRHHPDFALRYSNSFGDWDAGLVYFQGTARDPLLNATLTPAGPVLVPFYTQIKRIGTDIQATREGWLYKFEGFWERQLGEERLQAAGGVEYTFYQVLKSRSDTGIVAEYIWDDRGANKHNPFANDAFVALRWTANDEGSTAILAGISMDLDTQATGIGVEAERRFGDDYFVTLEVRLFDNVPASDPLYSFSDDDFIQLRVARYF